MSWHKKIFKLWRAIIIIISSCRCPLNEVIKKRKEIPNTELVHEVLQSTLEVGAL